MAARKMASGLATAFLGGASLGAGVMYLADPDRGARRRSLARDKTTHLLHIEQDVADKGVRDLQNRLKGVVARVQSARRPDHPSDRVLAERVRARLGRAVSHPGAIDVLATDGCVMLSGPVLSDELDSVLREVHRVRGVKEVESHLTPHVTSDAIPSLQGPGKHSQRSMVTRESWPPSLRLVATGAGAGLTTIGLLRRGRIGTGLSTAGSLVLLRATANRPLPQIFGLGAGRRAVELRKTITVHAPIGQVYRLFEHLDQLPKFMEHVEEVRVTEDGKRTHWKCAGPTGIPVKFDAETTARVPNRLVAWRTLPGQSVEHAGMVRFEEVDENTTRLDIQMSYDPPAGAVGHVVAQLFGKDAKTALDDDLLRLKSLLEEGKTRAHGERVTTDDIL